jgi:sulfite reductase (ferredoxin)
MGKIFRESKIGRARGAHVSAPTTLSAVEEIKRTSRNLRGDLLEQLASPTRNVSNDAEQLLKFHGIYAQDDRDTRRERSLAKADLDYSFMIRVAIPGGRLTTAQWRALDDIAGDHANGTLRLTTRQAVQFHGVAKRSLQSLATALHEHLMTSFGACGDVVRNVVACPGLQTEASDAALAKTVDRIASSFKPSTRAHLEVFVDGELAASVASPDEHAFYGDTYLPRKFKIAIAHPGDNCVDVFAQDLGLIPGHHPTAGDGFTVVVGGGLGRAYANPDTFPRLATPLCFVPADDVEDLIAAVVSAYRDLGDRGDRKRARLKYVLADIGEEAFAGEVVAHLGRPLLPALAVLPDIGSDDHLGWRELSDGTRQLGIRVSAGRVRDDDTTQLRTALREVARRFDVTFFVTPQQDLLISHVAPSDAAALESLLVEHGVVLAEDLGPVARTALACPALPTCSQALAESERRLPDVVDALEGALEAAGIPGRPLKLRLTGCPNGCARPAVAEVGIVGRTKSTYDLLLGGGPSGNRLASVHAEKVKLEDVPGVLAPLLERWRDEGSPDEAFGDFYERVVRS